MATITIQLPDALLLKSGASLEDLSRESQILLAFKYFQTGRLTSGQAAEMCGLNRVDFLLAAGRKGIAVADLDEYEY